MLRKTLGNPAAPSSRFYACGVYTCANFCCVSLRASARSAAGGGEDEKEVVVGSRRGRGEWRKARGVEEGRVKGGGREGKQGEESICRSGVTIGV